MWCKSNMQVKRVLEFNVCSTDGTRGRDPPGTVVAEAVAAWNHDLRFRTIQTNVTLGFDPGVAFGRVRSIPSPPDTGRFRSFQCFIFTAVVG